MYELTQHDDKYDLRYRLKDKIHLPSSTPPSTSSWSSSALISSAARSFNGADRSKKGSRDSGSSQESLHGRGDRRSGSVDGAEDGSGGGGQNGGRRFATATFLLVTWSNVILCEGRVLQLYDFSGTKVCPAGYVHTSRYHTFCVKMHHFIRQNKSGAELCCATWIAVQCMKPLNDVIHFSSPALNYSCRCFERWCAHGRKRASGKPD